MSFFRKNVKNDDYGEFLDFYEFILYIIFAIFLKIAIPIRAINV